MRNRRFLVVPIVMALAFTVTVPASAWFRSNFQGTWKGVDASDGSTIRLRIREHLDSFHMVYEIGAEAAHASWCPTGARMSAIGVLQAKGQLAVSLIWWCGGARRVLIPPAGSDPSLATDTYTFDEATDTFSDMSGTIYHRVP